MIVLKDIDNQIRAINTGRIVEILDRAITRSIHIDDWGAIIREDTFMHLIEAQLRSDMGACVFMPSVTNEIAPIEQMHSREFDQW